MADLDCTEKRDGHGGNAPDTERKPGRSRLVYDKTKRTIVTVTEDETAAELDRLMAINGELLQLARDVAEHFADTDAPLGRRARELVAAYDRS